MKRKSPSIVLVSCPYNDRDYVTRDDMAIDDLGLGYLYVALKNCGYVVTLLDTLGQRLRLFLLSSNWKSRF